MLQVVPTHNPGLLASAGIDHWKQWRWLQAHLQRQERTFSFDSPLSLWNQHPKKTAASLEPLGDENYSVASIEDGAEEHLLHPNSLAAAYATHGAGAGALTGYSQAHRRRLRYSQLRKTLGRRHSSDWQEDQREMEDSNIAAFQDSAVHDDDGARGEEPGHPSCPYEFFEVVEKKLSACHPHPCMS